MTYPAEVLRLIDERADRRIAMFAGSGDALTGATSGTINYRTGSTTCMCTLDGSELAVPVKVFGDVEIAEGDRVGLVRIGAEWTVVGTFTRRRFITMPDLQAQGIRMVWGADTPSIIASFGLTVAMVGYVTDVLTGLEVGFFFQGVSNIMDAAPGSRAMVFGNVTYPTAGNPASATVADVKTNLQLDMFTQFRFTLFKDHDVLLMPGIGLFLANPTGTTRALTGANARSEASSAAAVPTNITSTSFADFPGPRDVTLRKHYNGANTSLEFTIMGTCYASGPSADGVVFAVKDQASGTDYVSTAQIRPANNLIGAHTTYAGGTTIPSLAEGDYTFRLRWRTVNGADIRVDVSDAVLFRVREVAA